MEQLKRKGVLREKLEIFTDGLKNVEENCNAQGFKSDFFLFHVTAMSGVLRSLLNQVIIYRVNS